MYVISQNMFEHYSFLNKFMFNPPHLKGHLQCSEGGEKVRELEGSPVFENFFYLFLVFSVWTLRATSKTARSAVTAFTCEAHPVRFAWALRATAITRRSAVDTMLANIVAGLMRTVRAFGTTAVTA